MTSKESDELCDGDRADDKEIQDVEDGDDDIVDDTGFVHKWVQLDSTVAAPIGELMNL